MAFYRAEGGLSPDESEALALFRSSSDSRKQAVLNLLRQPQLPSERPKPYIDELSERRRLLNIILDNKVRMDGSAVAFLQFSDIDCLREYASHHANEDLLGEEALQMFMTRKSSGTTSRDGQGTESTDSVVPRNRSAKATNDANKRDSHQCVFTGLPLTESMHIVPHGFCKQECKAREVLFKLLETFWGKAKTDAWRSAVGPLMETCQNRLTVAPSLHSMIDRKFSWAIEPISRTEDGKEMVVKFHWLPPAAMDKQLRQSMIKLKPGPLDRLFRSSSQDWCMHESSGMFAHTQNNARIETGDLFTLETLSPKSHPLPNWDLLQLQWNLVRVCAFAGAGEKDDDDRSSSPSEGGSAGRYAAEDVDSLSLDDAKERLEQWMADQRRG